MRKIFLIIFIAVIVLTSIISALVNYNEFFKINITNAITLLIAVIFTYYFNQKIQSNRRFFDSTVKILESIQNIIVNEFLYKDFDKKAITELQQNMRIVRNKIEVLKTIQERLKINSEIEYLEENFTNYKSLIDNHINDYDYLNKSTNDLNNYISLLDSKITETIIKIYKLDI